nr:immunoglobulin heavy chain junction region [Mus musculus]NSM05220.1 immunoglobulin heavy chain junction region [Mus musculus]NSM05513.1 immunoglobulin heavy chain junction region [Mus musculus]NSM07893.1 immunoglobulin heavy chain junction region [Mus musculus]NSM08263.1 immunoglobulin heavy chain junction region [Mus musculus]
CAREGGDYDEKGFDYW